jgi:hypothetical protein
MGCTRSPRYNRTSLSPLPLLLDTTKTAEYKLDRSLVATLPSIVETLGLPSAYRTTTKTYNSR